MKGSCNYGLLHRKIKMLWLYRILILPIEYLIEVIFTVMNSFFGHEGFAIITVSIAISTLVLPLYLRADAIQEEEQQKQKAMEKWLVHIKKHFSGDERYMMTNAYYAEMNYKPLYALRGLIPLFLQIPFFIAAFHFLSNMQRLQGCSFGWIADLGAEDGMLKLGTVSVNLLPILMTLFNTFSTVIYTRGFSWKQKLQPYCLALFFLVVLYHSPSGLVLYWTCNNLYSFLKNVIMKTVKKPMVVVRGLSILGAAGIVVFLLQSGKLREKIQAHDPEAIVLYLALVVIVLLPVVVQILKQCAKRIKQRFPRKTERDAAVVEQPFLLTLAEEVAFTVLWGAVIPLLVIAISPLDFLVLDQSTSPLFYVAFATAVSAGIFLVWGNIIYGLADTKGKRIFSEVLFLLLAVSLMNVMLFCASVGNVSAMLEFDFLPRHTLKVKAINLLAIMAVLIVGHLFWKKADKLKNGLVFVTMFSLFAMAGKDIIATNKVVGTVPMGEAEGEYCLPLSKHGKNVLLLMMDRAIGTYLPFLFDEKPQLKEQFEGFTYYPNTLSFGTHTTTGGPALYGGYDYTAEKRNLNEVWASKEEQFDKAFLTMPVLFGEEGYHVTVMDPPVVDFRPVSDLSMFQPYPYINAFGMRDSLPTGYSMEDYIKARERNFVFYSIFRCMPAMLQDEVYDTGGYLAADRNYFLGDVDFRVGYTILQNLPDIVELREDEENYFLDISNDATHGGALLSLPEYRMDRMPDYTGIDIAADKEVNGRVLHFDREDLTYNVGHYHSNMASMLALGAFMDQLREWDVYDNTRIIIVSDHGFDLEQFEDLLLDNGVDAEALNPLLLVKDFDSRGELQIDEQFMMNADVPTIAMDGLIENPVSPFTGNPINMDGKKDGVNLWWPGGYAFKAQNFDGDRYSEPGWYHVKDNLFDENNWTKLDVNEAEGRPAVSN